MELCYRQGWTDGLPVVPPTEDKVRRFLEAAGREPDEALGFYTTRRRLVTECDAGQAREGAWTVRPARSVRDLGLLADRDRR